DNHPAFHAAASRLRLMGHEVYNPAEEEAGLTIRAYFNEDCRYLCLEADAIAMLSGWERSKGANTELMLSQCFAPPLPIFLYKDEDPWLSPAILKSVKITLSPGASSTTSLTPSRRLRVSQKKATTSTTRAKNSIGRKINRPTMRTARVGI